MKKVLMILIALGAIGWFASTAKTAEAGGCYYRPHHGGHYGYYAPQHGHAYGHAYRYERYNYYRPSPNYYPNYGYGYGGHGHGGVYFNGPRVSFGFGY